MSFLKYLNEFFASTTIHGLAYINQQQAGTTRFIWTLVVLAAAVLATYYQYQSITGFDNDFTSTTIETKSIQEFPFPAVTFHPGAYNLKNAFKRTFLNQFEFTRYHEESPLTDNDQFLDVYHWLVSPMHNDLFNGIETYLIGEKKFIRAKGRIFHEEVCALISLYIKNVQFRKKIRIELLHTMYKFRSFGEVLKNLKTVVTPLIREEVSKSNLSKSEITEACKNTENKQVETEMQAFILSYLFLFLDKYTDVGAGDLATGPFPTAFSRGKPNKPVRPGYIPIHNLLTSIYNDMVNGSLPSSIFEIPSFFVRTDKQFEWRWEYQTTKSVTVVNNMVELLNITDKSMRNYHFLWYSYFNKENITLFCVNSKHVNCTENPLHGWSIANKKFEFEIVDKIRRERDLDFGQLMDIEAMEPPCTNNDNTEKYKIGSICKFIRSIARNKEAFLKLMKFSKQSPVFQEDDIEHLSVFPNQSADKFGFTLKRPTKKVI